MAQGLPDIYIYGSGRLTRKSIVERGKIVSGSQGWARAPATDFHQTNEPKSMSDKSWYENSTVGLESELDVLPQNV